MFQDNVVLYNKQTIKEGFKMLYNRDKEIIEKLKLHAKGQCQQFSKGDIEYIIVTMEKCAFLENEQRG